MARSSIIVIGSFAQSLVNFRGPLLAALVEQGYRVLGCAPGYEPDVVARLSGMGVEFHQISMDRTGVSPWADVLTMLQLVGLFRRIRPDIVLSYTPKPVIYGSIAARVARVGETYAMITGLGYTFSYDKRLVRRLLRAIVSMLYKLALSACRRVFFQNPDDMRTFIECGLLARESQAVLINGSGVDIEHFVPAPFPDVISFLMLARLLGTKGVREYVASARALKKDYPEVRFRLAGWLEEHPDAISEAELASWMDEGVVEYLGSLDDVRPAIAASSVYVLPSFYPEGTPRSILEALAMARPVITSDAPGCRETVEPGVNGFLVPVKTVPALCTAMQRFIEDPSLIPEMGRASRRFAERKYDARLINHAILEEISH